MADEFLENTSEITVTAEREAVMQTVVATGKAILVVMSGGRRGERAVLGEGSFIIGRGSSADMQLDSDAVSRQHALIEQRAGAHVIVDQGSTNGSYVNYRRVSERPLVDGDQIQIGESMLKYLAGDNIETAYHEEFRRLVRRDALTGALNQGTFTEEISLALTKASRKAEPLSLIVFDLDHFKTINDTHGHTAGDLVLSRVGARTLELTAEPHLFARVGGEEFAIVYVGTLAQACEAAEMLRQAIAALSIEHEGHTLSVTASFGVAEHSGQSSGALRELADKKLYDAKSFGRNRVVA